jgi:hypothetical protein
MNRGIRELALLTCLYLGYSASRLVADDTVAPAVGRALGLLRVEGLLGLDVEQAMTGWFVAVPLLALVACYWYATLHYVLTAAVLVWLYRRGPTAYLPARQALAAATVIGLVLYLLVPMAPPRLVEGYPDVLALHSDAGWWGADASAPRGLGGLTNELAAFPSLHAGWALWVALLLQRHARWRGVRALGWVYAVGTVVVVVGTGNHWLLDAVAGWVVVLAGWEISRPEDERHVTAVSDSSRRAGSVVD